MAEIVWAEYLHTLLEALPRKDLELIEEKTRPLTRFPRMYPIRRHGRFRRHRWLLAGKWIVFYRVVDDSVHIRGIWPAVIP